jgi:hypothetical protein
VDLGLVSPARFERLRQQIKGADAGVFLPAVAGRRGASLPCPLDLCSDFTCNLCKPTELISFFGHCGCNSNPRQWQFTAKRKTSRFGLAYDRFSLGLNDFIFGFITTMWTPACTVNHLRRTRSQCLLKIKEMVRNFLKTGYYTLFYYQAVEHSVFAFFVSLGCIHRDS